MNTRSTLYEMNILYLEPERLIRKTLWCYRLKSIFKTLKRIKISEYKYNTFKSLLGKVLFVGWGIGQTRSVYIK